MNLPALRRALHHSVDLIVDALELPADEAPKAKRRRGPAASAAPAVPWEELPADVRTRLEAQMSRQGYKRAG